MSHLDFSVTTAMASGTDDPGHISREPRQRSERSLDGTRPAKWHKSLLTHTASWLERSKMESDGNTGTLDKHDSGYYAASTLSFASALRKPAPIEFPDQPIPTHLKDRFSDLKVLYREPLWEAISKNMANPGSVSMKLRYVRDGDSDPKLCIVILCGKSVAGRARKFFAQRNVREDVEPDFGVRIIPIRPVMVAAPNSMLVYGDDMHRSTLCGAPIQVKLSGISSVCATLGGLVLISHGQEQVIYGITAGHPLHGIDKQHCDTTPPTADDENDGSDCGTLDGGDFVQILELGFDDPNDTDDDEDSSPNNAMSNCIGSIPYSCVQSTISMGENYDWALIAIPPEKWLPNLVLDGHQHAAHEDDSSPGNLPTEAKQATPIYASGKPAPCIIANSTLFEPRYVAVMTARGLQRGMLSANHSSILITPGKSFVDTFDFLPSEEYGLQQGDSGSWVAAEDTGEVFGHVVSIDALGEAYVMPIHDTLQSIRLHFGAQYVDLPDHSTLVAHSKLRGNQKRDSAIAPIVTAPNTPPPSPRNVARRHSQLDMTLELPSKNDTAKLNPSNTGHYDSIETIAYQLRQLPKEGGSTNPPSLTEWNMKNFFIPLDLNVRVAEGRDCHAAKAGLTNVLSWMVDMDALRNGAHISFDEFSFDENGNVCRLGHDDGTVAEPGDGIPFNATSRPLLGRGGSISSRAGCHREIKEHILLKKVATQTLARTAWAGQRFGKEWKFGLNGVRDESLFSIAALQLCEDADPNQAHGHGPLSPTMQRLTRRFLTHFKGKWEISRREVWESTPTFKNLGGDVVFQYHMRALTAPPWLMPPGSGLTRSNVTLPITGHSHINIREVRYSVGLKTTWRLDFPVFCIVTMADSPAGRLQELPQLGEIHAWDTAGIRPYARATGVAAFSLRVRSLLPQWGAQWSGLLDAIERHLLAADLDSILSATRPNNITEAECARLSGVYMSILQILRIAADWVEESRDDLRQMVDEIQERYLSPTADKSATFLPLEPSRQDEALKTFKQNWESVIILQQRIGSSLLSRIAKEQEQVKSLHDGLFNAVSVSEATKTTQLNHYIMVFTIVTIFYLPFLPLSFIAALFVLDTSSMRNMELELIATMVGVAGGTYILSGFIMWAARHPQTWQNLMPTNLMLKAIGKRPGGGLNSGRKVV